MTNWTFRKEIIDFLEAISAKHHKKMSINEEMNAVFYIKIGGKERRIRFHKVPDIWKPERLPDNEARSKDDRLIHIWEDLWIFHREKVCSKLSSLFGFTHRIHGRETNVIKLNNKQLIDFLGKNHLNVPIKGKYKYGLVHGESLEAVAAFSKSRPITRNGLKYNSYELLRFCNRLHVTVVGGFTKLLNHFIKTANPDDIMTYVDADWSDGSLYRRSGFELVEKTPPIRFLLNTNTGEREYPHIVFKRHSLSPYPFRSDAEEKEFMEGNGYKEVYNSGSYKYLLLLR